MRRTAGVFREAYEYGPETAGDTESAVFGWAIAISIAATATACISASVVLHPDILVGAEAAILDILVGLAGAMPAYRGRNPLHSRFGASPRSRAALAP